MKSNSSIEETPLIQIIRRYLELLKAEEAICSELVENIGRLFEEGKLSSHRDIANILNPPNGE